MFLPSRGCVRLKSTGSGLSAGRMRPSAYYDRVVDVMEELFKVTLLMRGRSDYLTDRYSERNERAKKAIDRQISRI